MDHQTGKGGSSHSSEHGASSATNEELRAQIATLKDDLAQLSGTVKREAKYQIEDVQDRAVETLEELEAQIRKKPLQSAAIAAGIGFLLGAILSR
ncbi:MAG: DUF883 C-terminal domain-containing protein [Rhodomicrobiaceae bacterium]